MLRSIGVAEAYRGRGLSGVLLDFYLRQLERTLCADAAFGVFWKPNGVVPMGRTLEKAGFRYLEDAHMVWYEIENLVCPYCAGRCICDAAVYYRPIGKREP